MKQEYIELINHGSNAAPVLVTVGVAFWFKRWVNQVDNRLSRLEDGVQKLAVSEAVTEQQKSEFRGQFSQLRQSIQSTDQNVGQILGSIKKIWEVLEFNRGKLEVPKRMTTNPADIPGGRNG